MQTPGALHDSLTNSADQCAHTVLENIPYVTRIIRAEMRRHGGGVSLAQFRTLVFVDRNPGASLNAVAEQLGVTAATASASVDRLVQQGLLIRKPAPDERRRVHLTLTEEGSAQVRAARCFTQQQLAERLMTLNSEEHQVIDEAMRLLRQLFAPQPAKR